MHILNSKFKVRKNYGKVSTKEVVPNLIEMQQQSYEAFLQRNVKLDNLKDTGLQKVLSSVFPVYSTDGKFVLEYVSYFFGQSKYTLDASKEKSANYSIPLYAKFRLTTNDVNKDTGTVVVKDVKEQDVHVADIPLMTNNGTFIINGIERVIVSQIYRSPGVFIGHDKGKNTNGKLLYSANIIPHVGSWLDIEFDFKDLLFIKIDKRKKIPLTALLRCLPNTKTEQLQEKANKEGLMLAATSMHGLSNEEILSTFYNTLTVTKVESGYKMPFIADLFRGRSLGYNLCNAETGEVVINKGTVVTQGLLKKLERVNITDVIVEEEELTDKFLAKDVVINNEVVLSAPCNLSPENLKLLQENDINTFAVLLIDNVNSSSYIVNTVLADPIYDRFKALNEIYKSFKLTDAPNVEAAQEFFNSLFFNPSRYDLSEVGRVKLNERFGTNIDTSVRTLTKEDIINVVKSLVKVAYGLEPVDDIDHLSNRRVRSVGELLENDLRVAFIKLQRAIFDKMSTAEESTPVELINARIIQSAVKDFFGTSQLSQFMDQTNPLSEITHKRRLSALGPNGLTRERASFEVRDVHVTHYGRICPIETPEGANIGLINSLAVYARVNKYGFIETPYRVVKNGVVFDEVVYMTALQEGEQIIAQANSRINDKSELAEDIVTARHKGEVIKANSKEVNFMDISSKQIVSVAASLIPFLENDDANRALMGANMQRQAVPLIKASAPIVGTGMEEVVARDSGALILAKRDGVIYYVDSEKILVKNNIVDVNIPAIDVYYLKKFQKSNHSTCVNQKPIVKVGDKVLTGDVLADGQSTEKGELALGKNLLVAFMPWNGYNFEDSILISEKVVIEDMFTSVHIEEFEVVARDTKLGAEEITVDIPNVGEEAIKNLDEAGIVYVGAEVSAGDILVGKVTPKAETVVSAEEKLLKAIFGEKSADVKDTSLRVPSGVNGTVIGVRVFSRRGIEKDARSELLERNLISEMTKEKSQQLDILELSYLLKLQDLLNGQEVVSSKKFAKGTILSPADLRTQSVHTLFNVVIKDKKITSEIAELKKSFDVATTNLDDEFAVKISNLQKGDDLQAGVLKVVKVFLAVKRKLQSGDKMAGRHGNKGVVSKIVPIEDMPHLEDGTPVDICLSPLGVPSRMNVGQVLEVHLGWAAANVGKKIAELLKEAPVNVKELKEYLIKCYNNSTNSVDTLTDAEIVELAKNLQKGMPVCTPIFDGVKEKDINELLTLANQSTTGQVTLIDGKSGEPFERPITVGYIYMLKLHHLVEDKIHARSTGPYSLITQQPLGGKAQFGGQRFGEMEVWALEAYGASYTLQEMLTVKSDDQIGRTQVYESIIKGEETFDSGLPESFNVLVKELRSLGLNLETKKAKE